MRLNDIEFYMQAVARHRTLLEQIRAAFSTPGMSAGDVYENVAQLLNDAGWYVYDYDDPKNPYGHDDPGDEAEWAERGLRGG